jgi:hypothetical protein
MRNLYILSFILIFSILNGSSIMAQYKNVFWVHGMNDDEKRFQDFDTHFNTNYYIYSSRFRYSTSNGIPSSANNLKSHIGINTKKDNIVVTHSMGGTNSLYIYKYLDGRTRIGGIISFDAPFNGAYFANNVDNGTLTNLLNEANDKGLKGAKTDPMVAATFLSNPSINIAMELGIYSSGLEILLSKIPTYIRDKLVSNYLSDNNKTSLKVGSADIEAVQRAGGADLPSIAFFGNEDYPACIKLIKTMSKKAVDFLIDDVDNNCDRYYRYHTIQQVACIAGLNFPQAAVHAQLASNWKTSRDYWSTTFPKATNVMIGAYRTEKNTITYEEWKCVNVDPNAKSTMVIPIPECEYQWVTVTKTVTTIIDEPSDGLIPISSQKALPGCLTKVELLHMNHDEVTTDPYARDLLNQVFMGNIVTTRDPDFFILNPK